MRIDREKVLEIVRRAAPFFEDRKESAVIREKGVEDYVTYVDTAVQEYIRGQLGDIFPDVQFMAEEKNNDEICMDGDFWILDPVDGTKNLIRDYRASALSLGYVENGVLTFGVVFQPYLNELFYAERGCGAFLNGRPIHTADTTEIGHALVAVGTTPFKRAYEEKNIGLMVKTYKIAADIRRSGSAAIELAWVAAGRCDAFYEIELKPWDVAAGTLLVREAGGRVRDLTGAELDVTHFSGILAGNGMIDEALFPIIRGVVE